MLFLLILKLWGGNLSNLGFSASLCFERSVFDSMRLMISAWDWSGKKIMECHECELKKKKGFS